MGYQSFARRSNIGDRTAFRRELLNESGRGNLRFQAQHLRRICLPRWEDVDSDLATALSEVAINNDIEKSILLTSRLYKLNKQEQQLLG